MKSMETDFDFVEAQIHAAFLTGHKCESLVKGQFIPFPLSIALGPVVS
jgi:hypothetical protein